MEIKKYLVYAVIGLLALAAAGAAGYYLAPTKTVTVTKTKTEIKEVVKWKTKTVYKREATIIADKDTDCTEKFDPASGKLLERHCITKSHTDTNTSSSGSTVAGGMSNTTTNTETTTTTTTERYRPGWRVTAGALLPAQLTINIPADLSYTGSVERRVFGPLWVGVQGVYVPDMPFMVGLTLSLEF